MNRPPTPPVSEQSAAGVALSIKRLFTTPGEHPFDAVEWEVRDAHIGHGDRVAFEQREVEFPQSWSQNATISSMKGRPSRQPDSSRVARIS